MRKNIKLPDTLSGLLRVAVEDARKAQKDPRYRLNMDVWHEPAGKRCEVCMAGAVMAFHGKASPSSIIGESDYPLSTVDKLAAIDEMRVGMGGCAAASLGVSMERYDEAQEAFDGVRKHRNPKTGRAPWREYLRAADKLERLGL